MTPFRNDESNPFARKSPWPGMPQTVLRPTARPPAAGPPAEGEPEPPPHPVTLIRTPIPQLEPNLARAAGETPGPVAISPVVSGSAAGEPARTPSAPSTHGVSPALDPGERLPRFRPLDEEETRIARRALQARDVDPQLYDPDLFVPKDAPPPAPTGAREPRRRRPRPGRREVRLTPLIAAGAVGAGGTAALFLMVGLGRQSALTAPKEPLAAAAAAQAVVPAAPALRPAIRSEPPAALTAMTTPAARPPAPAFEPRLAMARVARSRAPAAPALASTAEPARIDIPPPPPIAAPEIAPAAAPAPAQPPPAPYVRPAAPDAQAPIGRHVPDPS